MYALCTELEISFEESQYSIIEGETLSKEIKLQFRGTQSPFTVTLYPVSITAANTDFDVGDFIAPEGSSEAAAGT